MELFTGIFGLIAFIILAVWSVLWFCIPFLVSGINTKLARLIEAQHLTIQALENLDRD